MKRNHVVNVWIVMLASLVSSGTAFVFPDMLSLRTGSRGQSRVKIAVLQEEPFLSTNGTGYVPDLLRLVADWYEATNNKNDSFPYDVIPVNTWNQLVTKASALHWQVSFGLIASSLLRNEESWVPMQSSSATLHTGLSVIGKVSKTTSKESTGSNTIRGGQMLMNLSSLPEGAHYFPTKIDIKGGTVLAVEGSPEEYLLRKSPKYRDHVKTVTTSNEAINQLQKTNNSFLIKDSLVAHHLLEQPELKLSAVCAKKSLTFGSHLYYAFFGRDVTIMKFLNGALKKLRSTGNDAVKSLNSKYFGHFRNCH